ncbi:MAG: abortive infection family protein [Thermoleophilia bacterium]|nr:abortive infection family protein [Thermoleophilia bacterium]
MGTAASLLELLDRLRRDPRGEQALASGLGILQAAVDDGLVGQGSEARIAQWVGELVGAGMLGFHATSGGARPLPVGSVWNEGELQIHHWYFVTDVGSADAAETRRLESRDRALVALIPERALAALSKEGRAALEEPASALEQALRDERHAAAIGSAKELLEAACRVILTAGGDAPTPSEGLTALVKDVMGNDQQPSKRVQSLARRLASVADALAVLRNEAGSGHGRAQPSSATAADAELASGAAITLVRYLLTLDDRAPRPTDP